MAFAFTVIYLLFVLIRPQELYPEWAGSQVMDILGGLAILTTALSFVMGHRPALRGPELPLAVAFLFWASFSVAAAIRWYGGAALTLYGLSISFLVFVLVVVNVTTRRRLAMTVGFTCASLLVVLLQAVSAYYSDVERSRFFIQADARGSVDYLAGASEPGTEALHGESEAVDRGTVKRIRGLGFLADPNDLAQAFVSAIPLVFLAWRPSRHFVNLAVVLPSAAALIWGILLSRSRGALVALAALFVAAVLYRLRPRYRRPATLAVLVLSIPAFIGLFGYAKADESAASRLEAWSGGLMMLKASPIWGVGMGLFVDHHERVAHNSYVQCFAETGLVGYFLWLGLIVVILERLSALSLTSPNTDWSRWARGARLALFGFLFAALFLSRTATPMFFFLTALPVALLGIAQREGQRVETPRLWWLHTLLVEAGSIIIVWITARAFH